MFILSTLSIYFPKQGTKKVGQNCFRLQKVNLNLKIGPKPHSPIPFKAPPQFVGLIFFSCAVVCTTVNLA